MGSKWNKEKENLERLILKENKSYEEIGRSYYRYHRSASQETENVENPLNDES